METAETVRSIRTNNCLRYEDIYLVVRYDVEYCANRIVYPVSKITIGRCVQTHCNHNGPFRTV